MLKNNPASADKSQEAQPKELEKKTKTKGRPKESKEK